MKQIATIMMSIILLCSCQTGNSQSEKDCEKEFFEIVELLVNRTDNANTEKELFKRGFKFDKENSEEPISIMAYINEEAEIFVVIRPPKKEFFIGKMYYDVMEDSFYQKIEKYKQQNLLFSVEGAIKTPIYMGDPGLDKKLDLHFRLLPEDKKL